MVVGANSVYINSVLYDALMGISLNKTLNQIHNVTITLANITTDDKVNITYNKPVEIYEGSTLIFRGYVRDVEYNSIRGATVKATNATQLYDATMDERVQYDNVDTSTIVTSVCAGTIAVGTNQNYGKISVRFEYDSKLRALAQIANICNYEWWIDRSGGVDRFNISSNRYGTTPVKTLTIGDNAKICKDDNDTDHIYNDITVLGRGDGINQVKGTASDATSQGLYGIRQYTYEDGSILACVPKSHGTNTSVSSGKLIDSSAHFQTDGVQANDYVQNVTDSTNTTVLSVDSQTQLTLNANIFTAVGKYYQIYSDLNTLNSTAYKIAASILANYKDPLRSIEVEVFEAAGVEIGQWVTLIDDNQGIERCGGINTSVSNNKLIDSAAHFITAGVMIGDYVRNITNGTNAVVTNIDGQTQLALSANIFTTTGKTYKVNPIFKVSQITVDFNKGKRTIKYILNNYRRTFQNDLSSLTKKIDMSNTYGQGATNIYSIQSYENCDDVNPLSLRFYVPPDAVAINKVTLYWKPQRYRAYETATTTNTASTTVAATGSSAISVQVPFGSWTNAITLTTANVDCDAVFFNYGIELLDYLNASGSSAGNGEIRARIYDVSTGLYYPAGTGFFITAAGFMYTDTPEMGSSIISYYLPGNRKNCQFILQLQPWYKPNTGTAEVTVFANYLQVSTHTHNMAYAITKDTFPTGTPKVQVWVGQEGSEVYVGTYNAYENGANTLDITNYVIQTGADKWVNVKFIPQDGTNHNRLRIEANVYVKLFIESKV